jgi:hypothetical protein
MTINDLSEVTASKILDKRPFNNMKVAAEEANIRKNALKRLKIEN